MEKNLCGHGVDIIIQNGSAKLTQAKTKSGFSREKMVELTGVEPATS